MKKPFPPVLKEMLKNLLAAKTKQEKDHWKRVALKYISFIQKES